MGVKRGKLSNAEEAELMELFDSHTDQEIAKIMNRTVDFIKRRRPQNPVRAQTKEYKQSVDALHASHIWPRILQQILPDEINYFEQSWVRMIDQFSDQGIVFGDEMMIRDYIMQDILIIRSQIERKEIEGELKAVHRRLGSELKKKYDDQDQNEIRYLRNEIQQNNSALIGIKKSIDDMQRRKEEAQKQLKMNRDSRFKNAQESKVDFWEKMKELSTQSSRRKWGRKNLLAILSAEAERLRLSEPIEFEDSSIDSPFLCPPLSDNKNVPNIKDIVNDTNSS